MFREPLAEARYGKPVTDSVKRYEKDGAPVAIYDTPGIELGHRHDDVIRDYKKLIAKYRNSGQDKRIHIAWYCINVQGARVEAYEFEIVRALAAEVPVILVLTQCINEDGADELERVIEAEKLPIEGRPARTIADRFRIDGHEIPSRGLEELVERTTEILAEAVRRAFKRPGGKHQPQSKRSAKGCVGLKRGGSGHRRRTVSTF